MTNAQESFFENEAVSQKKKENFINIRTERPKFCIYCGAPLEDDDEFCTECGAKIESELAVEEESVISKESSPAPKISSDRLASIMETESVKSGGITDEFKQSKVEAGKSNQRAIEKTNSQAKFALKTGYYVHKDQEKTQYLIIESICGSSIKAAVKTIFVDGSYSTEHYTGTISCDNIELSVSGTDLHPLPNQRWKTMTETTTITHSIKVADCFSGVVSEDKIAGNFTGHFSQFVVFTKC